MCYSFNPNGLKGNIFEKDLCESYDRLITWIFDETMFHQNNPQMVQQIVKNYNKLPLNL